MREHATTARTPPVRPRREISRGPGAALLELQRTAGNRAAQTLLARDYRSIGGGESLHAHSEAEFEEAKRIVRRIKRRYGIKIDSGQLVKATKARYSKAPAGELMKVRKRHWHLNELRALERACKHFAPILGPKREGSTRKPSAQEITTFGKGAHSIDHNTTSGIADDTTLGEQYKSHQSAGLYKAVEGNKTFAYANIDKNLEWICTHELAHGLMDYIEEDFRKAAGYWKDYSTKTGSGEAAFTKYAESSLGEDLAESTTAYFMKRKAFAKACPKRFAVIDAAVAAWKPLFTEKEIDDAVESVKGAARDLAGALGF